MAKQTVSLYTLSSGERVESARAGLSEALESAQLGTPDEAGMFEVTLDADSPASAEEQVREALAASGTGDDFVLRASIAGRQMPADDPRQPEGAVDADEAEEEEPPPPSPDERAEHVRTAASRVEQMARQLADAAPSAIEETAERIAQETPERVAAAARRLADEAPPMASDVTEALHRRDWRKIGPPAAAILGLLVLLRRITRGR